MKAKSVAKSRAMKAKPMKSMKSVVKPKGSGKKLDIGVEDPDCVSGVLHLPDADRGFFGHFSDGV